MYKKPLTAFMKSVIDYKNKREERRRKSLDKAVGGRDTLDLLFNRKFYDKRRKQMGGRGKRGLDKLKKTY